jgi:putative ABC transport system permease protein
MRVEDVLHFAWRALWGYRVRTALMLLAMAIGVASVVVLIALGEGARRFVIGEFAALGTHLLIVLPGRAETSGGHPPILGETPRDLTLEDALSLLRSPHIRRIAPIIVGAAPVSRGSREREVTVLGTTADYVVIRNLEIALGRNLPAEDPRAARPVCLLGAKVREELFGVEPALGHWLRVGDRRYRVTGILRTEGRSLGIDMEELVLIPVASAEALFDTHSLFRILAEASSREQIDAGTEAIRDIIRTRHDGEDDVTVIAQDALVATFDKILQALTATVGGIAAISLLVAGILTMNVMLVAVSQRTAEIGLLKALGAAPARIQRLFLAEAALLSLIGALLGLGLSLLTIGATGRAYPVLDLTPPAWAMALAVTVALGTGLSFGLLPARRAAALDPVAALARR